MIKMIVYKSGTICLEEMAWIPFIVLQGSCFFSVQQCFFVFEIANFMLSIQAENQLASDDKMSKTMRQRLVRWHVFEGFLLSGVWQQAQRNIMCALTSKLKTQVPWNSANIDKNKLSLCVWLWWIVYCRSGNFEICVFLLKRKGMWMCEGNRENKSWYLQFLLTVFKQL